MPQTVCRVYGSSLIGCSTAIESFQEALIKQRASSVWIVTLIPHMSANLSVCRNNYYHCLQYGIRIYTVCNNQFCHEKSANSSYCTRIFKFKKIYTVYIAVCRCITLTDINHYLGKHCNYLPDNYFLTLAAQQKNLFSCVETKVKMRRLCWPISLRPETVDSIGWRLIMPHQCTKIKLFTTFPLCNFILGFLEVLRKKS